MTGEEFFDKLQDVVDIRTILLFNYYDSTKPIRLQRAKVFRIIHVDTFINTQANFKFFDGQIKMIEAIAEHCKSLYDPFKQTPTEPAAVTSPQSNTSTSTSDSSAIFRRPQRIINLKNVYNILIACLNVERDLICL